MIPRLLAAMSAVLLLAACGEDDLAGVETGDVIARTVVETVEAPGTVVPKASATVTAAATGTIAELRVADGDKVAKGQQLMTISSPEAQQRLKDARKADQAAVAPSSEVPSGDLTREQRRLDAAAADSFRTAREAAAQLPLAADRARALASIRQSEADYRSAQAASARAVRGFTEGIAGLGETVDSLREAQRVQTRAALASAERTVDSLVIRAPMAGTVTFGGTSGVDAASSSDALAAVPEQYRSQAEALLGGGASSAGATSGQVSKGAPVTSGATLLTVTDVSELSLEAEVDETDVLLVKPGVKADVEFDAIPSAKYDAAVTTVAVSGAAGSGGGSVTYPVRLRLGAGTLSGATAPAPRPGMSAVLVLEVRTARDAISVPSSALFRDGAREAVWVVEGGRAHKRVVQLGAQGDDVAQVVSGVVLGERLVVKGTDKVTEDQQLP